MTEYPLGMQEKAKQICRQSGVPYPLALKVASGEDTLSNVLNRMLLREKVSRLVKEGIPASTAEQILDGKATKEQVLLKFRARKNVYANLSRSAFSDASAADRAVALLVDPDRVLIGRIAGVERYDFDVVDAGGVASRLSKLSAYCLFDPAGVDAVLNGDIDEAVRGLDLAPELSPHKRFNIKHAVFQKLLESGESFSAVTRRGRTFRGRIQWYSLYELGMLLDTGPQVTLLRHSLHHLVPAAGRRP